MSKAHGAGVQAGPTLPQAIQSHTLQNNPRLITRGLYDRGAQDDHTAPTEEIAFALRHESLLDMAGLVAVHIPNAFTVDSAETQR